MPKLDLFLDEHNYPAKLLMSDVSTEDMEDHQLLTDGLAGFMSGDAKVLIIADEYDVKVHDRG
jgi:hypothetical protein